MGAAIEACEDVVLGDFEHRPERLGFDDLNARTFAFSDAAFFWAVLLARASATTR